MDSYVKAWLIWQQGCESTWMQLDAAIFQCLICINPYKIHFPGRCQSVLAPPDAWASLTKGRSKLRHFGCLASEPFLSIQ